MSLPRGSARDNAADDDLLRALFDEYGGPLYGFALRLTGDRERAEEVAQETLLRAWEHPEVLAQGVPGARAWLFTIARNLVTDLWRRDSARPRTAPIRAADPLVAPDEIDRALDGWLVNEALDQLRPEHRQVLALTVQGGHSVARTAALLDIPHGTVKSRTYYGLRALRAILEEMGFQP